MRELDSAIVEALGYRICLGRCLNISDGNAMLELVTEMSTHGWGLQVSSIKNGYIAKFCTGRSQSGAIAKTMPEAITLAAYKVLTEGKGWPECNI